MKAEISVTLVRPGFIGRRAIHRIGITDGSISPSTNASTREWKALAAQGRAYVEYIHGGKREALARAAQVAKRLELVDQPIAEYCDREAIEASQDFQGWPATAISYQQLAESAASVRRVMQYR
jgi:hypothetical protein